MSHSSGRELNIHEQAPRFLPLEPMYVIRNASRAVGEARRKKDFDLLKVLPTPKLEIHESETLGPILFSRLLNRYDFSDKKGSYVKTLVMLEDFRLEESGLNFIATYQSIDPYPSDYNQTASFVLEAQRKVIAELKVEFPSGLHYYSVLDPLNGFRPRNGHSDGEPTLQLPMEWTDYLDAVASEVAGLFTDVDQQK